MMDLQEVVRVLAKNAANIEDSAVGEYVKAIFAFLVAAGEDPRKYVLTRTTENSIFNEAHDSSHGLKVVYKVERIPDDLSANVPAK